MNRSDSTGEVLNEVTLSRPVRVGVRSVMPSREIKEDDMKITHDGSVSFASADSRKAVHWKNREVLWSDLVDRLSKTKRTAETQAEYAAMPKTKQDVIKDVGGFVGGILKDGRRKAGNVSARGILTLDADTPGSDLWDTFGLMYDCAACVYSTHKHTPEKNRLRFVIPLSRRVSATEYEAISRKVAFAIGIDAFDDTTYEAERLMYWPSTSVDGEFYFRYQDGKWLDPDAILAEYDNWQDPAQWPVSSRTEGVITREKKKAGDPVGKHGIVGAFCRSYDIHEAIETHLSDIYQKCEIGENRYTYQAGSTAGGLITYEDKWAYSHHGTDPAGGGKLHNAFDLVRIHLFGQLDENAKPGTPAPKIPSYIAMQEFATNDEKVKMTLGRERLQSALDDFGDASGDPVGDEGENDEWITQLKVEKNGTYSQTIENTELILTNDQRLKSARLSHNDFSHTNDVTGVPPWPKSKTELGIWSDFDYAELLAYMEKYWGITSERVIKVALRNVFSRQRYHPVRDHLDSLAWDGIERVETLLIDYLGAEDNPYTRAVIRKTLAAAVARIFRPGCKVDYVLVIVGPQGIYKSMLVQILGYADHEGRGWYSDNFNLSGRGDKRDIEQLLGVWIMEIPELAALYGKNADAIKSFISTRQDEARLAYKEEKGYFPRQCIFIGTTNNVDFLSDSTGNRRFWPVVANKRKPKKSVKDDLSLEVDQIWAEAVQIYKAGEALYLDDPKLEAFANVMQEQHREKDSWEDTIAAFLETPAPPDYWDNSGLSDDFAADKPDWVLREKVTVEQVYRYALGEFGVPDNTAAKRIKKILRALPGWKEYDTSYRGTSVRAFKRNHKRG